jgi:hypothetical protein
MSLKTENSRRVAKSRPVCMGLYARENAPNFGRKWRWIVLLLAEIKI